MHHLKPVWVPAFRRGEVDFGDRGSGLPAVLGKADARGLLEEIRKLLLSGEAKGEARVALGRSLITTGGDEEMELVLKLNPPSPTLLNNLADRDRPKLEVVTPLENLFENDHLETQVAAMRLVAHWKVEEFREHANELAQTKNSSDGLRLAAIHAVGSLGGSNAKNILVRIAADNESEAWHALREGRAVLMLRHALAPGTGDPANFDVDDCSTQRNLNAEGREQARAWKAYLAEHGIDKEAVRLRYDATIATFSYNRRKMVETKWRL